VSQRAKKTTLKHLRKSGKLAFAFLLGQGYAQTIGAKTYEKIKQLPQPARRSL
jgi:hypothetical protein